MGNSNGKPVVFTDQVSLDHFRLLRVVGKGAFGKVRIVERKDTGLTFALKYIRKDEVVRSESVRNMIRERRMLEHLNHPFLCNLRYSFQDVEYLYLVVDLMTGGDLRFHISRKAFTEDAVRFWIAQLGCALRYVHQQGIVHRDVKPDNVLLDSEGHVHLADFNVATDLVPGKPLTSKSGTLAYLAPEVYRGKGYNSEVDWWSLGVLYYECIYNKRPFEGHHHEQLAQAIVRGEPAYPVTNPPVSMVCKHSISSLLEKDKNRRIGAAGWETFTDNPFFREIDFEALERKEIEPVFRPSSEKTNFDATYDLEELLLEEAPLEARTRKQKPRAELRPDATHQEIRTEELHRMIETMFEPFNYMAVPEQRIPVTAETKNAIAELPTPLPAKQDDSAPDAAPLTTTTTAMLKIASIPTPCSATPGGSSRTHSSTRTADGSPPLSTTMPPSHRSSPPAQDYFQAERAPTPQALQPQKVRALRYDDAATPAPTSSSAAGPAGGVTSAPSQQQRKLPPSGPRSTSHETPYSSSDVASAASAASSGGLDSKDPQAVSALPLHKPTGMLGFLNRKKGRDRSPKARERGVLGKEGARMIVSQ